MSKARIEAFDGTGDVDAWIRKFLIVVDCNLEIWSKGEKDENLIAKMINRRACNEIRLAMTGPMADWIDTLDKSKWDKYTLVLDGLKVHLHGPDFERDQKQLAIALKREDCDSEADYYSKKVSLLSKAFQSYKADVTPLKIDLFIDGLKPNIRGWILKEPVDQRNTLEKIHVLAQQYEKIFATTEEKDDVNALYEKTRSASMMCTRISLMVHFPSSYR